MGFDKPTLEPKETRVKKTPAIKKRNLPEISADDDDDGGNKPPARAQRVESDPTSGVRRSSRNAGKTVDYRNEVVKGSPVPISFSSGVKTSDNSGNLGPIGRLNGKRKYDPLAFLFFFINISLLTPQ
jgi:E3 ubiquitin-protein ligase UHRF1